MLSTNRSLLGRLHGVFLFKKKPTEKKKVDGKKGPKPSYIALLALKSRFVCSCEQCKEKSLRFGWIKIV